MGKPTIFISYSHTDEKWKDRLATHFGVLERQGALQVWEDSKIVAGDAWFEKIEEALGSANAAILMISAEFLTSEFILANEVPVLFQKRAEQGVRIFPLIVRPCAWRQVGWLERLNARPRDGKPLSTLSDSGVDVELAAFVEEIGALLKPAGPTKADDSKILIPPAKIFTAKLPVTGKDLFGRKREMAILDSAWKEGHTSIVSLAAFGGVGKSALVNHWLNRMGEDDFRGAVRVYGWSFYSQGASEERQASADEFFDSALRWFGDPDSTKGSSWDKGVRLAGLIREERTLLILDGMEPLQYPPGEMQGLLKDQGLKAMLKELARSNPGLCVVTTRVKVRDLENFVDSSVRRISLENLSTEAGAMLLENLGVKGAHKEIRGAAEEFKGHALALNLLGRYLVVVHDGDVRKRDLIPGLAGEEQTGGHARRVMESYERWLGGKPELDILYMMGLFDRPAREGAINALRADPPIEGLTGALQGLSTPEWKFALQNLRDLKLLSAKDGSRPNPQEDILDCHPLVRQHFGRKLRVRNPGAWKEAHGRLYEYYKDLPEKEFPDTLEEMEPLFAAVAHGCQAGRHQEALYDVYWERIKRKEEAYTIHKLGAFGSDLAALSGFFEVVWSRPVSGLTEGDKAVVLSWAGFRLRALGRLREAAQPMEAGLDAFISQENWEEAAAIASNLSELYLTLGDVKQAVDYGRRSVDLADQSGDAFEREIERTTLADALHQAGEFPEAERLFQEAEAMQKERQPDDPYLISLRGFQFCDLLLSKGEYPEVQKRAMQTLEWAIREKYLLDISLDKLSIGRAHLLQALKEKTNDFAMAEDYLNQAVEGLREAGVQDLLLRGLLTRAALHRMGQNFDSARADLEEAREIAEQGSMGIHLLDYHLEAARFYFDQDRYEEGRENLEKAGGMVEEMGYHRRDGEIEELTGMIGMGGMTRMRDGRLTAKTIRDQKAPVLSRDNSHMQLRGGASPE